MEWGELECRHQNAHITSYVVQYGRTNVTNEIRSVTTTNRVVKSDVLVSKPGGLGFLHFGSEYWLRVAAINGNGRGPFSRLVRATPLSIVSGKIICTHQLVLVEDIDFCVCCISNLISCHPLIDFIHTK